MLTQIVSGTGHEYMSVSEVWNQRDRTANTESIKDSPEKRADKIEAEACREVGKEAVDETEQLPEEYDTENGGPYGPAHGQGSQTTDMGSRRDTKKHDSHICIFGSLLAR